MSGLCLVRRIAWVLLLAAFLAFAGGCIQDYLARLRGTGFDESSRRLTSEIPQRAKEGKPFTFSTKAQEIEADFGYQ